MLKKCQSKNYFSDKWNAVYRILVFLSRRVRSVWKARGRSRSVQFAYTVNGQYQTMATSERTRENRVSGLREELEKVSKGEGDSGDRSSNPQAGDLWKYFRLLSPKKCSAQRCKDTEQHPQL